VLCDVGLIYMEKPNNKEVKLFPFLDYEVKEIAEKVYDRKFVFRLKTIKGHNFDMVMQAYSKLDYEEWLSALKAFKCKLDKARSKGLGAR